MGPNAEYMQKFESGLNEFASSFSLDKCNQAVSAIYDSSCDIQKHELDNSEIALNSMLNSEIKGVSKLH